MAFPTFYAILIALFTSFCLLLVRRHATSIRLDGPKDMSLPLAKLVCIVCFEGPEEGKSIFRCSMCKNQFYCSQACQNKHWSSHKYDCSLLPPEGLASAGIECNGELRLEVARVSELLKRWMHAFKAHENEKQNGNEKKFSCANLSESNLIASLELLPVFAYSRLPPMNDKHVYRTPLMLISRLFLMHLVATLPAHNLKALANKAGDIQMPSHVPRVFGPKLVARPADLSPGEYDTLMRVCVPLLFLDDSIGLDEAEKEKWLRLCLARKELWNA